MIPDFGSDPKLCWSEFFNFSVSPQSVEPLPTGFFVKPRCKLFSQQLHDIRSCEAGLAFYNGQVNNRDVQQLGQGTGVQFYGKFSKTGVGGNLYHAPVGGERAGAWPDVGVVDRPGLGACDNTLRSCGNLNTAAEEGSVRFCVSVHVRVSASVWVWAAAGVCLSNARSLAGSAGFCGRAVTATFGCV